MILVDDGMLLAIAALLTAASTMVWAIRRRP